MFKNNKQESGLFEKWWQENYSHLVLPLSKKEETKKLMKEAFDAGFKISLLSLLDEYDID